MFSGIGSMQHTNCRSRFAIKPYSDYIVNMIPLKINPSKFVVANYLDREAWLRCGCGSLHKQDFLAITEHRHDR